MPIKVQSNLPAKKILEEENIFIMDETRALHQDIRPLKIVILNLMPLKEETELQLLRSLSNTPLQVDITFLTTASYIGKNTAVSHLEQFYLTFEDIKEKKFDGLLITGAPVEQMEFEKVSYWEELKAIMEWSKTHITSTLHVCWGAQAGLYYHYGINKKKLDKKMFGIFPHKSLDVTHPLMRGLDDEYYVPHSRHTTVDRQDIAQVKQLQIISYSDIAGVHIVSDMDCRQFFVTGHSEYDRDTLAREYFRDKSKGLDIEKPYNYFPNDDENLVPNMSWKSSASIIFSNWLNYFVYQKTPYDLSQL